MDCESNSCSCNTFIKFKCIKFALDNKLCDDDMRNIIYIEQIETDSFVGLFQGEKVILRTVSLENYPTDEKTDKNKEGVENSSEDRVFFGKKFSHEVCGQNFASVHNLAPKVISYWICEDKILGVIIEEYNYVSFENYLQNVEDTVNIYISLISAFLKLVKHQYFINFNHLNIDYRDIYVRENNILFKRFNRSKIEHISHNKIPLYLFNLTKGFISILEKIKKKDEYINSLIKFYNLSEYEFWVNLNELVYSYLGSIKGRYFFNKIILNLFENKDIVSGIKVDYDFDISFPKEYNQVFVNIPEFSLFDIKVYKEKYSKGLNIYNRENKYHFLEYIDSEEIEYSAIINKDYDIISKLVSVGLFPNILGHYNGDKKTLLITDYKPIISFKDFLINDINDDYFIDIFIDLLTKLYKLTINGIGFENVNSIPDLTYICNREVYFFNLGSFARIDKSIENGFLGKVLKEYIYNFYGYALSYNKGNDNRYYFKLFVDKYKLKDSNNLISFFSMLIPKNLKDVDFFRKSLTNIMYLNLPPKIIRYHTFSEKTQNKCDCLILSLYQIDIPIIDTSNLKITKFIYKDDYDIPYSIYYGKIGEKAVIVKYIRGKISDSEICCQHFASNSKLAPKILSYWESKKDFTSFIIMEQFFAYSIGQIFSPKKYLDKGGNKYSEEVMTIVYKNLLLKILHMNLELKIRNNTLDLNNILCKNNEIMFLDYHLATVNDVKADLEYMIKYKTDVGTIFALNDLVEINKQIYNLNTHLSTIIDKNKLNTHEGWNQLIINLYNKYWRFPKIEEIVSNIKF